MSFEEKVKQVPPEYQKVVEEFVDKVLSKTKRKTGPLPQSWGGELKDIKHLYTSVELQHKVSEWIAENVFRGH